MTTTQSIGASSEAPEFADMTARDLMSPVDAVIDDEIQVSELGCAPGVALSPLDSMQTCAQMLVEYELDAIPVLDGDQRVLGLVTVHDIARAAADVLPPFHGVPRTGSVWHPDED